MTIVWRVGKVTPATSKGTFTMLLCQLHYLNTFWYCTHAHEHVFSTFLACFLDLPSDPETLGGICAWDAGGSMDLDSRDKQRIHTDHSHLCINLLRRLNKSDLPRPNTNIENAANSFYSDTIPLLNLLYWQKWNVKLALMVVLFVRHTRSNMVAGYDAIEILHWNSTLKFYNCHVKRSESWLVLPTPEQWKSTVWTRISCQAVSPTNGLGKANCERILFIYDTIKYTRLWQSLISERVKDANDSPQRSHGLKVAWKVDQKFTSTNAVGKKVKD